MSCLYQPVSGFPPCLTFSYQTYKNLQNFLDSPDMGKRREVLLTEDIDCITYTKTTNSISVDTNQCISCGLCAFNCPGEKINFSDEIKALPSCSGFKGHSKNELDSIKAAFLTLNELTLDSFNTKFNSFEKYTGVNETRNISIWAASVLKYVFGVDSKVGLEIPLTIDGRDRNGRLDICLMSKNHLIVMESKIGLKKLLAEGRYESQILAYDEEITSLKIKERYQVDSIKLLLIGDNEKDLLPANHDLCNSKVGNLSDIFYQSILSRNIQFISARGLLALAISKFYNTHMSIGDLLVKSFKDRNTIGLLSNTLIKRNGDEVYLQSLNL
jgi:ferredoxin